MNKIVRFGIFLGLSIVLNSAFAQEECKVLMPSISGKYEGECKKGKANGNGQAEGADTYAGIFKDGLPNGQGIYKWENGNIYSGVWAGGKRDGEGTMTFKRAGKADSLVTGFWKKDKYVGRFEKPYKVYNRSVQVSKSEVKFKSSNSNDIIVLLSNTTGNMPSMSGRVSPKATLTDVNIAKGRYIRLVNLFEKNQQTAYKLEQVTFPFRAKFRIGGQEVDVEFMEDGEYTLDIALNN